MPLMQTEMAIQGFSFLQIQSTPPKDHIHQNILSQLLFLYKRLLEGVLLVFEETFQDLQIAIFPFNTVFPLNINLYQLSYSPGV